MKDLSNVRNFCIIAHIDHGKSTLADRLMEITGVVAKRDLKAQLLDSMELERERGITIKLTPVTMKYHHNGKEYILNLIDTPGHVDFSYEVSRSLKACEGAILVVDSTQGVEAQTLANVYLALDSDLEIVPVLNKVDLPSSNVPAVKKEIEDIIGLDCSSAPCVSAKTGLNCEEVLEKIITEVPAPKGDEDLPLKALIFDSYYDNFKGAVCLIRVFDGKLKKGDKIKMMQTGKEFEVTEVGVFSPTTTETNMLEAGDVGYLTASIKTVADVKIGDTVTLVGNETAQPLAGYKEAKPMVYSGIFPVDGGKYAELKDALDKLKLNDASLTFAKEHSTALGSGFRCGFLGLLHMDIITERITREFNIEIINTAPSVAYRVTKTNGDVLEIKTPTNLPDTSEIAKIEEPVVKAEIFTPPEYVGELMELAKNKRGEYTDMTYIDASRVKLSYTLPLNEIVYDFFDSLKSLSHGYASFDYEIAGYKQSDLVRLDFLLNGEPCDALSLIVHRSSSVSRGRAICEKLKDTISRQLFEIPIQATIGGKIIARETVKALRKDVTAKCYGGDISRKRKLLEKQKEGKKRMRKLGSVELPAESFISILKN